MLDAQEFIPAGGVYRWLSLLLGNRLTLRAGATMALYAIAGFDDAHAPRVRELAPLLQCALLTTCATNFIIQSVFLNERNY